MTGELGKVQKASKSEVEKLTKALEQKDAALTQHLIDAGLTDAAVKAGIGTPYLPAVRAMFKTQAKLVATSCHNCLDQLAEVSRKYKLGAPVKNLCELVADAIVLPKPPAT